MSNINKIQDLCDTLTDLVEKELELAEFDENEEYETALLHLHQAIQDIYMFEDGEDNED